MDPFIFHALGSSQLFNLPADCGIAPASLRSRRVSKIFNRLTLELFAHTIVDRLQLGMIVNPERAAELGCIVGVLFHRASGDCAKLGC